jgi:DNA-binding CsgD family transcriptional regulator
MVGGTVRCRWQYFGIPEIDPDYHLLIYEPIDDSGDSAGLARKALQMERALFQIRDLVEAVNPQDPPSEPPDPVDLAGLTERELDVMKLLLDGHSNEGIAQQLHLSVHTIKSHAQGIFRKLGVRTRAELLSRFVRSMGFVGAMVQEFSALI